MPRAIDAHVHPPFDRGPAPPEAIEAFAAKYRDLDIKGNLLATDARSATGRPHVSNEYVAGIIKTYPDTFIGFGSVDPWQGKMAIYEVERCIKELGLIGIKFRPYLQEFFPNDPRFYPIWEKCQELKAPVLFHTGTTGAGRGLPGGRGIHLKYGQPIPCLDDVAADFPELTIIGAHPSFPWQDEMLAVAVHKANVYIDLSGWAPKYFSPKLIQYCNTLLKDKALFGSDYPALSPERWLTEFEACPFKEEVRPKILKDNAIRVLGLS